MKAFEGTARYKLIRKLGQGGMGAVYEVEDGDHGVSCALKVMGDEGDTEGMMRFKREFRAVAALRHPNLVRLFELHSEEGRWFYTMELVDGASILEVLTGKSSDAKTQRQKTIRLDAISAFEEVPASIKAGPNPRPACDLLALGAVLSQILDGLEFLHSHGKVHRDLKPENILIDVQGRVRLVDFGIVKDQNEARNTGQKGDIVGTLLYMAPEQATDGQSVGPEADLYSLGCVLYELLTGETPFAGHTFRILMAHQAEAAVPIEDRVLGVPAELAAVCHDLMAKDPMSRPSIPEVRRRLSLTASTASTHIHALSRNKEVFVGRDEEMAALLDRLERTESSGAVQVVMLQGESGVGKTCLTNAAVDAARARGFSIFRGRCYEREALPFRAFDQIMDGVALTLSAWPAKETAHLRDDLAVASCIFPALHLIEERVAGAEQGKKKKKKSALPTTMANLGRLELRQVAFERLRQILARLQEKGPLLLAIDDLQWTDAESMALLGALLKGNLGRVVILGMFRPEGVVGEHPLRRLLNNFRGREEVLTLALSPLSRAEISQLMHEVVGEASSGVGGVGDNIEPIVAQTGGNPFFAMQLALMLTRREVQTQISQTLRLPTISELVTLRFGELSDDARRVLELAATAGGASSGRVLRKASGLSSEAFTEALDALMGEQLMRPSLEEADVLKPGDEVDVYDLYHDKFREIAYAGLGVEKRLKLHKLLAEVLEGEGDSDHAEALLRHWQVVGERPRIERYALQAAEDAEDKLAFGRAATLYRMALDHNEGLDWRARLERLEHIGDMLEFAGEERRAIEGWREVVEIVQTRLKLPSKGSESDKKAYWELRFLLGRARRRLAASLFRIRELGESQLIYQEVLSPSGHRLRRTFNEALAVVGWLQFLLVLTLMIPDTWFRRQPTARDREKMALWHDITNSVGWMWLSVALEYNARSSLLARRLNDNSMRLQALVIRAGTVAFSGNTSPFVLRWSHKKLDEAEAWARRFDVKLGVEFVQRWRGSAHVQDDMVAAREVLLPCVEGYARHGALRTDDGVWALGWLIIAHEMLSEHTALLDLCRSLETYQNAWANAFAYAPRVRSLSRCGELDEGERLMAIWEPMLPQAVTAEHFWYTLSMGMLDVKRGRFEEVIERQDRLYGAVREYGSFLLNFNMSFWVSPYLSAMVGLARQGKLTPAKFDKAFRLARRLRKRGIVVFRPMGARAEALLSHFQGKKKDTRAHLSQALAMSATCQAPYHRWMCLEAAREIEGLSEAQEDEASALQSRHSFVREP